MILLVFRVAQGRGHDRRFRGRCRRRSTQARRLAKRPPASGSAADHGVIAVVRAVRQLADRGAGDRARSGRLDPRSRRRGERGDRRLHPRDRRRDGADHGPAGRCVVRPGARHEGPAPPVSGRRHDRRLHRPGAAGPGRSVRQRPGLCARLSEFAVLVELGCGPYAGLIPDVVPPPIRPRPAPG